MNVTRSALVTGATGGVGRAVARAWTETGGRSWLLGRRMDALDRLRRELGAAVRVVRGDLTSDEHLDDVAAAIVSAEPGLDLLVHTAGAWSPSERSDPDDPDVRRLHDLHVRARLELTRRLVPALEARRGTVVFVNSSVATRDSPAPGPYAASMRELRRRTDELRDALNPRGIRVVSLFLGRTHTPMQERIHETAGRTLDADRLIRPETVARSILDLAALPEDAEITEIALRPMRPPADAPASSSTPR